MNRSILILIGIGLIAVGCSRKFGGMFNSDTVIEDFDFKYLSARAKIRFDDGARDLAGTAQIRVAQDSAIWVSVSPGLGVEVARILITTDSVFFLDRINNKYLFTSYRELSNIYDFPVNYKIIESLIVGNLAYPFKRSELIEDGDGVRFSQIQENFEVTNFIGGESKKLEHLDVSDVASKNSISVNYSNFKKLNEEEGILPHTISAIVEYVEKDKQTTQISIGYNKAQLLDEQPKLPFNVPEKYKSY
ncbi:MAG: DUF4292 domain-containing protein [Cyclobacteriaceae bacterium]